MMPRRWLVDLVEGYRWLWSAQRRWHPGSRWWNAIGFGVRVSADIMRLLIPPLRTVNRLRVKHLALASLVLAVALVFDAQRRGDPGVEPTIVTWADTTGGFEVVFPAGWVATDEADDETRPAMAGSTHRRPAGGGLLKRQLTARAYDLGVIPPGITTKNLAFLASGIRAPGETIVRPALSGEGTYVTAYRSPGSADDASNAAVFFRGRDGHGFMLEITGHREDSSTRPSRSPVQSSTSNWCSATWRSCWRSPSSCPPVPWSGHEPWRWTLACPAASFPLRGLVNWSPSS
jgi:hypothetical protein